MSLFITFEGGEGSGKSSQARMLYRRLNRLSVPVLLTHEPGVTSLGRKIARWLKWAQGTTRGTANRLVYRFWPKRPETGFDDVE